MIGPLERLRMGKVRRHAKAPDASPEKVAALSGIIKLTGPVPSTKFMQDESEEAADSGAGD